MSDDEVGMGSTGIAPVATHVARMRAFNRFYTRMIGVLQSGLVGTRYSLTEARVLFEVAHRAPVEVADLRRVLGLDAGYLSRILARFAADGLIVRERSPGDARRQLLRLTDAGSAEFAALDAAQVAAVEELLGPLPGPDRRRVMAAMDTIREAFGDIARPEGYLLRPPEAGDFGWVVARHGALYAQEYGWDTDFEALVARIVADYLGHRDPKREAAWIAEVKGEPVGCVFCVSGEDGTPQRQGTATLRLLLVEPSARGMGIGARLVEECLRFARRAGYRRVALWTNDVLTSARRIYEDAGFHLDEQEPHHSFGHDLVAQVWSRDLTAAP